MGSTLVGTLRVADIVEDAARSLLAVDVPVCWRVLRPFLGGPLAVVGCWPRVHRGSLGSVAVLLPVSVGAGVPGPAGLCVLRGQALSGLPPSREWPSSSPTTVCRGTSIPGYPSLTVGYPTEFQKGGIDIPPGVKMQLYMLGCQLAGYWPSSCRNYHDGRQVQFQGPSLS